MTRLHEASHGGQLGLAAWLQVLGLAVLFRWLGYSGYFGSDEVTYTESALRLLNGDWSVPTYVGANRMGVNLPVAAFAALFGVGEASLAAYSVVCSVAEVAVLAALASRLLGARVGWLAGLILATLPMHAHLAGRLLADAPLSLAMTATFLCFALGERTGLARWFLLSGLAAGWSFWVKPHAVFFVVVLMVYPVVVRRIDWKWSWVVAGFAVAVLANCALFQALTGRFWFMFEVIRDRHGSGYLEADVPTGVTQDAPWFYLVYLFGKVYHTWLLGPLALAGLACAVARPSQQHGASERFAIYWAVGLVLVLSILPVKFQPLLFMPKQTNYMSMFAAPLALLAGVALAHCSAKPLAAAVAVWVAPAAVLTLLLQTTITVFTANAKGVVALARSQPTATFYATTNPLRAAQFDAMVNPGRPPVDVRFIGLIAKESPTSGRERFAVIDAQTLSWGSGEPYKRVSDVPACWVRIGEMTPVVEGLGARLLAAGAAGARMVGAPASVVGRLQSMVAPIPAPLFKVPEQGC